VPFRRKRRNLSIARLRAMVIGLSDFGLACH